jgi:hypothetical protein
LPASPAPPAPANGSGPAPLRISDTGAPLPAVSNGAPPGIRAPDAPAYLEDPGAARTPEASRIAGARSELRRQLREQKRVRAMALAVVVVIVLGAPMLYFGVVFATRDPVLNSLDRLEVPSWAALSPEDRVISGSRWCFIDCRFRERTLVSERSTEETAAIYQAALQEAGWIRWQVEGCPQVAVDGDYSCWTRDEYTLDLWVHPPECAYDPLNQRPAIAAPPEAEATPGAEQAQGGVPTPSPPAEDCTGSVVEIKMQNRVADERGLSGPGAPPPASTVQPSSTVPPPSSSAEPSAPAG